MRIIGTGHAGLRIETAAGSVLCDPWSTPAYFASWFPFPANDDLDWDALGDVDFLYVSHLHRDHCDPDLLRRHVRKDATVLLPDYPTGELEQTLRDLGFRSFIRTRHGRPLDLDGLRIMIIALTSPTDGPIGDSALVLDDGTACVFNQNDAHPLDMAQVRAFGPVDAHLLQFSGAIWWPMVYDLPGPAKEVFAQRKRERQTERAFRYVDALGARHVFPNAGPPCFLDEGLDHLNDPARNPMSIFTDQVAFLDQMRASGRYNGELLLPGTQVDLQGGQLRVRQPWTPEQIRRTFVSGRTAYLRAYAARSRARIDAERRQRTDGGVDVVGELKAWWEPLLGQAERICAGVGGPVRFDVGAGPACDTAGDACEDTAFVVDFPAREVRAWAGERCRYWFRAERSLVHTCIQRREPDWVNSLFLSLRFIAGRVGPYNEYVYTFFKCLTPERINYAEGWYASREAGDEEIALDGWRVQRRCPHLMADLAQFGEIADGVLTCHMHGWQFELASGRCLTSPGHALRARPAAPAY
ncbi:MAG: Rieske 2Fe-2S domain-containing protein [Streptomycetales bacterium]